MEIKTILVDMDGVLADFDFQFIKIWRERYPGRFQLDQDNRTSSRISDDFPSDLRKDVREIYTTPGFYRSLPEIPGAIKAINDMAQFGIDVWICTSPLLEYENCVLEKYQWIDYHLGKPWTERIILTRNKILVRGDVLIDDCPDISDRDSASWEQILFDAPCNRSISTMKRMTWRTWRTSILA